MGSFFLKKNTVGRDAPRRGAGAGRQAGGEAGSLLRRRGDDRVQRRLRLALTVERERALAGSPGSPVVQPPERDAIDRVAVLHEDGEQLPYASAWA